MAEPGWYNAAGDPPGSQRYWDGNGWIGDPVFEPSPVVMPPPPQGGYSYAGGPIVAPSRFPTALKTVAIIVSVLKAIPLVFGLIAVLFLVGLSGSVDDQFDNELGFGLDNVLGSAIAVILVILLIGGLLLGFQFVGALKERPMMVFIPALIMSLLDGLLMIGSWATWLEARNSTFQDDSTEGVVLMTAVAAAQIYIAVQAIRANGK